MYFKFCPSPLKSPFPFCLLLFLRFLLRLIIDVVLFVAFLLFLRIFYLFGRFFEFVLRKPILLYSSYKAKKAFYYNLSAKNTFYKICVFTKPAFSFLGFCFSFLTKFFFPIYCFYLCSFSCFSLHFLF